MTNILIIGAGNMGKAIAKGLLNNHNNIIYFKTHNNKSLTSDFDDYVSHKRVFFNSEPHFFNR